MSFDLQVVVDEHKSTHVANEETDFIYAYITRIKETKDPESEFYGERGCNTTLTTLVKIPSSNFWFLDSNKERIVARKIWPILLPIAFIGRRKYCHLYRPLYRAVLPIAFVFQPASELGGVEVQKF